MPAAALNTRHPASRAWPASSASALQAGRFSLLPLTVLSMAVGGSFLSGEHEIVIVVLDGDVGLRVARGAQAFGGGNAIAAAHEVVLRQDREQVERELYVVGVFRQGEPARTACLEVADILDGQRVSSVEGVFEDVDALCEVTGRRFESVLGERRVSCRACNGAQRATAREQHPVRASP